MKQVVIAAALALTLGSAFSRAEARQNACSPSGGLSFLCGPKNTEDLVLIPNTRWLIASGMAPGSGLHLVDTEKKTVRNLYSVDRPGARADSATYPGCPGPLDPKQAVLHGLSLRPTRAGRYVLYATNHGGRESIEVFDVAIGGGAPSVTWVGCVPMPDRLAANSVAAFSDRSIVATVLTHPGKTFEDLLSGRNTGAVYLWTPGSTAFRMLPGTELPGNNGIETSPDDREFYVVSSGLKRIVAFSRANPSSPLRFAQLREFAPDNVRFTAGGRLITAGMIDDEPACGGPPKGSAGVAGLRSCPRGYIVATIDPKTMAATELARGPATPAFSATSIAMPVGGELWIGSFSADRLAYRSLK